MTPDTQTIGRLVMIRGSGYFDLLFRTNPSKLDILLLAVGTLAAIGAGIPFPLLSILFGELVDDLNSASCNAPQKVDESHLQSSVTQKVLYMIYISIGNFVAIYIHASCWSLFGERLVGRLRRQYFRSLLHQEMAFFDTLPAGEVSTRLTTDMETIRAGTSEKVGIFTSSLAYFVGAYIVAFMKVPKLAGMLTFMIPAFIMMVFVGGRYVGRYTSRTSHHLAAAAALVSQSLTNVTLIHALGANKRLEAKLIIILGKAQRAALKKAVATAIQFGFMFLVAYSANALAFWQGSKEIARTAESKVNNVSAGGVYTVIFVLLDASFVISQVAPFIHIFGAATAAAQTLKSIASRVPRIDSTSDSVDGGSPPDTGHIIFTDVSFAYPARPETQALKGVSLTVAKGNHTAIVGASGSGKSTLGGLLTRLYDPSAGNILLDGVDIANLNVRHLRRCIGVVDQDSALLPCSILENIAFGVFSTCSRNAEHSVVQSSLSRVIKSVRKGQDIHFVLSKEPVAVQSLFLKIQQAAIMADAHSFICNLKYGYATLIGSAVCELSGGQKQRLALARALVKDPPILLLDEATSALDSISEQKILNSLKAHRKGKTTITIAHRLGTVKDADLVIVMQDGQIVEQGTHDDLIASDGPYSSMTELQSLQVANPISSQPSDVSTAACSLTSKPKPPTNEVRRSSWRSLQRLSKKKETCSADGPVYGSNWSIIRGFVSLARPHLSYLVVGVFAAVIAGGAYSGDAVIFGNTIGNLNPCKGPSKVRSVGNLAGLLFFILALAAFLANSAGGSAFGRVAEKVVFRLRILTFRSLLEQDLLWHVSEGRTPVQLLSYFTVDTNALAGLSGVVVGTILTILVNLIASILMTHIIAWKIAIVLLATLPILLGSGFMRLYALSKFQARHQKLFATPAGISLEAVASIKTIAHYSLEEEIYKRYSRSLRAPYKACLREFAYTNFWLATAYSISTLIYALAYWWGAKQISAGVYSQTQFFIVLPALLFSAQSCGQMFALAPDVSNARVAATRLFELIKPHSKYTPSPLALMSDLQEDGLAEKDPEKALNSSATKPSPLNQPGMAIEARNINFAYPNRPDVSILTDLTLSIQPGQFCALVGPSGAGKSTIFSLLESFYTPTSGSIYFDNHSTTFSHTNSPRSSISLVPQSSTLFSDTISFNVGLGAHPSHMPTATEIEDACKAANIHSLITSLPDGYDTQCGASNFSHFSGGQKQRLCIARALVRKPRLLLLDEPTSALDAEAEAKLQETIESLRGRMTILVVAHRLYTIRRADQIFWIENGRCTHVGTHEEMLVGCKGYRESARHQDVG